MKMKSEKLGKNTSDPEVTHVSKHGFWLLLSDKEFFVPFSEFPWFKNAPIGAILRVEWFEPDHLHWPDLDVDLSLESIEHPDRFPLISKSSS
jgi:hypothetical protein